MSYSHINYINFESVLILKKIKAIFYFKNMIEIIKSILKPDFMALSINIKCQINNYENINLSMLNTIN